MEVKLWSCWGGAAAVTLLLSDAFPIIIANRSQNSSLLSQNMALASWLNSLGSQMIGIDL